MEISKHVWIWSGPRWANVTAAAKDRAAALGLKYQVDVDKGWITERGRITVEGPRTSCRAFLDSMNRAMSEYNKGD